jgi:hypothetical protein
MDRKSFYLFPRNRSGDISITIFTIGVVLVYAVALALFSSSDVEVRNSFFGIGQVQKLNSLIEQNEFYGGEIAGGGLYNAIEFASKNRLVNRICNCEGSCDSYVSLILESSAKYGIDPFLLLSLMMQESDCSSKAFSGSSVGLMQVNLIHCGKYGLLEDKNKCKEQLIYNVQLNIDVGARILKENYDLYKDGKIFQGCSNRGITYYDWDAALRAYNGWVCGTDSEGNKIYSQDDFVEEVNKRKELLKKSANYIETNSSEGFLWWKKSNFAFSVEYLGE